MGLKKETLYVYETPKRDYKGKSIQDIAREMDRDLNNHIDTIKRYEARVKELLENVKTFRQYKQQSIDSVNLLKNVIKDLKSKKASK